MKPHHFPPLHRVIYAALLFVCMVSPVLFAQVNLVPNPSFKSYFHLPVAHDINPTNDIGQHWITRLNVAPYSPTYFTDPVNINWFRANQATPDYYHSKAGFPISASDSNRGVRIPQNWGQEENLWGASGIFDSAYAGISIVRFKDASAGSPLGTYDYHEFLAVKLSNRLSSGKEYLVQFRYALPEYDNTNEKKQDEENRKPAEYYLEKLGVAFAPNTGFLEYDNHNRWWSQGVGSNFNALGMAIDEWNYVEVRNLQYVAPGEWKTFESRFICWDSTLEYMIIGNFDRRMDLDDISPMPGILTPPDSASSYQFYFFIDSAVVKEIETGSCNCTSIYVKMSYRDSTLEASNPDHCCFIATIAPTAMSCDFSAVRVSKSGIPISDPPITNFGHIVTDTEQVQVSLCIEKREDEESTVVTFEFLDEDSIVVCTQTAYVNCNCECGHLQRQWGNISVLREEVASDSGRCCWEYSVVNKGSCDFLPSTSTLNVSCSDSNGFEKGFFTTFSPWIQSDSLGVRKYSSNQGFLHSSETTPFVTKVFKVCINPQAAGLPNPLLTIGFSPDSNYYQQSYCRNYSEYLSCIESENCCDKLNIELRPYSHNSHDCAFDLILSNKGSTSKCKVFGVRLMGDNGDTLYTLNPQSQALNLDKPKQIWYHNLGACAIVFGTGQPSLSDEAFIIEILDSTGTVKCTVRDTIHCCIQQSSPSKSSHEDNTPEPVELPLGGMITQTSIVGNTLNYSLKNMGDALGATIRLSDLKGNALLQRQVNLPKSNSSGEFDITQLANGTYFLSVQSDLWQTARQIVIVR